ncbi:MAG: hypothetical protein ACOYOV_16145 [Bacteroidales bacterium]
MGKINTSIVFLLLFSLILIKNLSCQSVHTIDMNTLEKPFFSIKGQTLKIRCDTAVLISTYRYMLYEKARMTILTTGFDKYNELIDAYDTQLRCYKQWNDSLQLKYTAINMLFKNTIENTKTSMTSINNNLSSAKDTLVDANSNLDQALQHLKVAKREKWYFAAIGCFVGSLFTILLVSK